MESRRKTTDTASRRLDFRFAHCVLVEEIKHSRSGDDTDDSGAVRQSLVGVS